MTKPKEKTQVCTACKLPRPLDHYASFQPGHRPVSQCRICREIKRASYLAKDKPQRSYAHRPLSMTQRHCHDCGAVTTDYRCPPCLEKWRDAHGVSEHAIAAADAVPGGDIVGSGCRHSTGGKPT